SYINSEHAPNFSVDGTAEPGATVQLAVTDGTTTVTASRPVASDGTWSVTSPDNPSGLDLSGLADGPVTFTATAVDAAENASPATAQPSTKDVVAPSAPAVTASDTGFGTDVTVNGTGDSGDTVLLTMVS